MSNLLDNIGKFRTLSDEVFADLIRRPSKYEKGNILPEEERDKRWDDAFTQRYLHISAEDFVERYMRQRLAGVSKEMIRKLVHDTCVFFGQNDTCSIYDVSNTPLTTQMRNSLDEAMARDELYYNLDELIRIGVTTIDAFTLVLTHEFAHRYFKHNVFCGRNHGAWEMELACDFFAGIRSRMEGLHTTGLRWSLSKTFGSKSHPPGTLRMEIINFANTIVYKRMEMQKKITFKFCLDAYNYYMKTKAKDIWEEQQKIDWGNG